MRVECCVESFVLEDDDEDVPNGRRWSVTLLCECIRRRGCDCGARERGGEKASLTGTHHETKGLACYPTVAGRRCTNESDCTPSALHLFFMASSTRSATACCAMATSVGPEPLSVAP